MAVVLFAKTCLQPASKLVILANRKAENRKQRYETHVTTTKTLRQRDEAAENTVDSDHFRNGMN